MSWLRALILALLAGAWGAPQAQQPNSADLDALLDSVRRLQTTTLQGNREREQRFLVEKDAQATKLAELRASLAAEQARSDALQQAYDSNEKQLIELQRRVRERSGALAELSGIYRQVWGDTRAVLENSLISSQLPRRLEALEQLALRQELPSIAQLEGLWFALQQEMTESGKLVRYSATVVGADGSAQQRPVSRAGTFTAVSGGSLLRYLPETGTLQELARQPGRRFQRTASEFEQGASGPVPMVIDPSRGALLDLLGQVPDVGERVMQGRLIGYIIIAIALIGAAVAAERAWHLALIGRRIRSQLGSDIPNSANPLGQVMAVYHENRGIDTETLELKLDEAILKSTPALQRGLVTVRILAVIAPMLGLLGTVTGLIETFQSITLFGTGDPRLMAGGISQALVTTVLGLGAAIPLILMHSALNTRSKRLLAVLEEQSAGLIARHAEQERHHAACA
ncbi:MAG: MotA/TolQ/ExbB proton channel family protein [Gammaproteobacteria bacterium]|nr:MAG: MotA/TolQ/ExbB proton channel family protein [Gammaproteobacteria bacterium]